MTDDVTSLNVARAIRDGDNSLLSPLECVEDAAQEIRSGARTCDKVIVVTVDTSSDRFAVGFYAAQIRASEMVAALEALKTRILTQMGFTE